MESGSNLIWLRGHRYISPSLPAMICTVTVVSVHICLCPSLDSLFCILFVYAPPIPHSLSYSPFIIILDI